MKIKQDEFMCRCSDEGVVKCDKALGVARGIVGEKHPLDDDLDFANRMLYWLSMDGELSIYSDQWAVVSVSPFKIRPNKPITDSVSIQCDDITDGLAAAIVFYYGK